MKKLLLLFLVLLLCTGCGKDVVQEIAYDDQVYTMNTELQTITVQNIVYRYTYNGNTCTITYPNGGEYWWTSFSNRMTSGGSGGWNDSYDEEAYLSGDILIGILNSAEENNAPRGFRKYFILVLLFALAGLWNLLSPHTVWYLSRGWWYKNAEPSDIALGYIRFCGGVLIILAVVFCFIK